MTCIIGLTGLKGSGKSTVAKHLVDRGFVEFSFAEPLKKMIADIFHIEEIYCYDATLKQTVIDELGVNTRTLMQKIGTELFREELPRQIPQLNAIGSVWIYSLVKKIQACKSKKIVISDVRFQDEYNALIKLGAKIIKIHRPSLDHKSKDRHLSEKGLECPHVIVNDTTIENLLAHVNEKLCDLDVDKESS